MKRKSFINQEESAFAGFVIGFMIGVLFVLGFQYAHQVQNSSHLDECLNDNSYERVNLSDILGDNNINKFCQSKGFEFGWIGSLPTRINCHRTVGIYDENKMFDLNDIYDGV